MQQTRRFQSLALPAIAGAALLLLLLASGAPSATGRDAALVSAIPPGEEGETITAGRDSYSVKKLAVGAVLNSAHVPFGDDFFGMGSLQPTDSIDLMGVPLNGPWGPTNFLFERKVDITPSGSIGVFPIAMVGMDLQSIDPLPVHYMDGGTEFWHVKVILPEPSPGQMLLFATSEQGGFFEMFNDVFPELIFEREGDGETRTLNYTEEDLEPVFFDGSGGWTYECPEGLLQNEETTNFCGGVVPSTGDNQGFCLGDGDTALRACMAWPEAGRITIKKTALPQSEQNFQYLFFRGAAAVPEGFTLRDDPHSTVIPNSKTMVLAPDSYTVVEVEPEGWTNIEINCEAEGDSTFETGRSTAVTTFVQISLHAGDHVTCTFVN